MPTISRPTKTAGNTTYSAEFAAGATTIKDTKVDDDLNLLYATINALDHTNLVAGAGILGSQLDAAAAIVGTQLAAGANIAGTQLAAAAGILGAQLAAGAAVHAVSTATPAGGVYFGAEITVATFAALTSRGGRILLGGAVSWVAGLSMNGAATTTVLIRVKRGATTIHTGSFVFSQDSAAGILTLPIPTPFLLDTPAAGTYTYTVTLETTGTAGGNVQIDVTNPGLLVAVEFA